MSLDYKRMPEIIQERKLASNIKNDTSALTFNAKRSDSRSIAYSRTRAIQSDSCIKSIANQTNDDYYDNLMKET